MPAVYPTLASLRLQLLFDIPVVVAVSVAAFALDAEGGLLLYLVSFGLFVAIGAISAIFLTRSLKSVEDVKGALPLSSDAKILTGRELRLRALKRAALYAPLAALVTIILGMQGAGMAAGGAAWGVINLVVWQRSAAQTSATWFSPEGWWRKKDEPWLYYAVPRSAHH